MTEEELKAIEVMANEAGDDLATRPLETAAAAAVIADHVPALIAEVRRLQKELRRQTDAYVNAVASAPS